MKVANKHPIAIRINGLTIVVLCSGTTTFEVRPPGETPAIQTDDIQAVAYWIESKPFSNREDGSTLIPVGSPRQVTENNRSIKQVGRRPARRGRHRRAWLTVLRHHHYKSRLESGWSFAYDTERLLQSNAHRAHRALFEQSPDQGH